MRLLEHLMPIGFCNRAIMNAYAGNLPGPVDEWDLMDGPWAALKKEFARIARFSANARDLDDAR